MHVRTSLSALSTLGFALAATATPLTAQAQTTSFYRSPAVAEQGANTTPIAGAGTVMIKVFVKPDGTPGDATVSSSTNTGDNAAALEIAKKSRYRPAARDGKPVAAYYTYKLKFGAASVSAESSGESGTIGQAHALVNAGKYAEAKAALEPYLAAHPGDHAGLTLLGVADAFANDAAGATAAFDKAGTIDPQYAALAATAYTKVAQAQLGKADDQAIAAANRAIALAPSTANGYNLRALAEYDRGDNAASIADFNKTLELAGSTAAPATKAAINANLAAAYLRASDYTNATAKANAAKAADPGNTLAQSVLNQIVVSQAVDMAKKGQVAGAVAHLEAGAAQNPSQAGMYYTQASILLADDPKPDWTRVKAEADKALAAAPNDAQANYLAGVALANAGKMADAKPYLVKAKANVGSDAALAARIDVALKRVSP